MRRLEDMRGALTPEEDAVFFAALATANPYHRGYLSGRRLAGLTGPLVKARADLRGADAELDGRLRRVISDYSRGFIAGWWDNTP